MEPFCMLQIACEDICFTSSQIDLLVKYRYYLDDILIIRLYMLAFAMKTLDAFSEERKQVHQMLPFRRVADWS